MNSLQGRRIRRAARIYLFGADGRFLLFRFDVPDRPPFWCPPGGECEEGESYEAAAARELFEETGIVVPVGAQVDRVISDFTTLQGEPVTGDDRYFRVEAPAAPIDTSNHTETERAAMRSYRWFAPEELADWPETIYPLDLAERLARL